MRDPQKIAAFLAEDGRMAGAWWRETVLLTAGYLGLKSPETAVDFLQALIALPAADEVALAAAELAATAFLELDSQDGETKTSLTERLVDLAHRCRRCKRHPLYGCWAAMRWRFWAIPDPVFARWNRNCCRSRQAHF